MDTQRLLLAMMLAFVSLFIYQAWMEDYGPKPVTPEPVSNIADSNQSEIGQVGAIPGSAADDEGREVSAVPTPPAAAATSTAASERPRPANALIEVRTDTILALIDPVGGDIRSVKLLKYPVEKENPEVVVQLLADDARHTFIAESGLVSADAEFEPKFDHNQPLTADRTRYALAEGEDAVLVTLRSENRDGLQLTKTLRFPRSSYEIDVTHELSNQSDVDWTGFQYAKLTRSRPLADEVSMLMPTYHGAALYSQQEHYEKLDFDDMDEGKTERTTTSGWAAFIQHYFVGAWVPQLDAVWSYTAFRSKPNRYVLQLLSEQTTVPAGTTAVLTNRLYMGPKVQDELESLHPKLPLSVDYGFLSFIAIPLFWVLDQIHDFVGNWGWSIILLTVLIKLVFFKLSETSYRSMARMRTLTPKLQALRERYADDKQALNQAMMNLYKTEKINPVGGCWPMLVQIPVFIALYWTLLESAEMRQAPWALWIDNLSAKDPYYILPLLMGISMFVQQKLNPAPPDPMQAKIMMSLPVVFTVFFAFFPSGLVLYWLVNNLLSIAQQWVITRRIEQEQANKN